MLEATVFPLEEAEFCSEEKSPSQARSGQLIPNPLTIAYSDSIEDTKKLLLLCIRF